MYIYTCRYPFLAKLSVMKLTTNVMNGSVSCPLVPKTVQNTSTY